MKTWADGEKFWLKFNNKKIEINGFLTLNDSHYITVF